MTAYLGRVVRAVLPTVSASSAGGFWNPVMAQYYQQAGTWPEGSGADPYFDNTTLLLHGDGTNGAQNNTFLDGSTNNFTITRNGNATQGSFNPYVGPGNWSDFYASTSSGWQTPANSVTSILGSTFNSTATFTVEAWIYPVARHSGGGAVLGYVFGSLNLAGANADWSFGPDSNGNLVVFWYQGSNQICKGGSVIPLNTWTHIALSVSAGSIKMFVNGVQETTTGPTSITLATQALNYVSSGGYLYAGTTWQGFNGYISNLRVIGKRAAYTTTFTPSTTPLVATSDTTLLTNNQNGFTDLSGANWTLTRTGSVQISKFSPFTLYQTTPASYSGYFDGTGDYLSLPSTTASGNFTLEFWAYRAGAVSTFMAVTSNGATTGWIGWKTNSTTWTIGDNSGLVNGAITVPDTSNTWAHFALVKSGTTMTLYVNGASCGSGTSSGTFTINQIGCYGTNQYNMNGSLSNIRFVNGTAIYTGNFTPPTAPLTAISGTVLLTCQSTTFIDNSTNALAITANGNATPERANPFTDTVTGPTPYSTTTYGGSAYFDGSGDYLTLGSQTNFAFGTGDFTIEAWIYPLTVSGTAQTIYDTMTQGDGTGTGRLGFDFNTSLRLFTGAGTVLTSGGTMVANSWQHVVVCRSSGSTRLFINGAQVNTTYADTNSYTIGTANRPIIGVNAFNASSNIFSGYMANLRVIKGTAVYTSPFVPPAAPVTAVTNTQLLLNGTNAGIFDNTAFADLETVGNTQISTSVVKYGTGSIYFDGAGDWLIVNSPNGANDYAFGSGDFTLEMWIYPTDITSVMLYDSRPNSSVGVYPTLYINSSSSITYYTNGSDRISGASAVINTWQHIALVRASGTTKLYINGTQSGSTYTDANTYLNGASRPIIGVDGGNTSLQNYAGYIDDLRITKGVARYTANFTPPAGPFPNF